MADLDQAMSSEKFEDVAGILDGHELELHEVEFPADWPIVLHMLAHMYNYNLEDARFLWKRTPPAMKENPELQRVFQLLQRLWTRDYQGVWGVLGGFEWSPSVQPLQCALSAALRKRMMAVVQRAYATLTAAQLASYLGASEQEALQVAASSGWEHNAVTGLLKARSFFFFFLATPLTPPGALSHLLELVSRPHIDTDSLCKLQKVVEPKEQPASRAQVEHLQRLTEYVTHLES